MPRDRPPGLWKSLKRALGGGDVRQPPAASPPEEPFAAPPFLAADEPAPAPVEPVRLPPAVPAPSPLAASPVQPPEAAPEPVEDADRPRLARGLASFSRSNADREKKFAHLLRDDSPGSKNR